MIRVHLRLPRTAAWRECRRQCVEATKLLRRPSDIQKGPYKACGRFLAPLFSNKCAYCEGDLLAQSSVEVEHFRPKQGVRDEANRPVLLASRKPHPGYWWLAYDYKNLLPACSMCNNYSLQHGGKGNRFPVVGFRATRPGQEKREKPLLINPARENPERFLDLDLDTGELKPRTERGRASILVYGLNREKLLEQRQAALHHASMSLRARHWDATTREFLTGTKPLTLVWRKVAAMVKAQRRKRPKRRA